MRRRFGRFLLAAAASAFGAAEARAGAYQLREGSAAALGAAFAGRTAGDRDVSFSLHNPAALRSVERREATLGLAGIVALTTVEADATAPGFSSSDDPSEIAVAPSFALGWRVGETIVVGLASRAPFGLATGYDATFIGAFDGVDSELTTFSVTPQVALSPTPWLALGAGVSVQYARATLTNRVETGVGSVDGDSLGVGFALGALVDPWPGGVIGGAYRHGVGHTLKGRFSSGYTLATPDGPLTLSGDAETTLDLPAVASIGLVQTVAKGVRVMGEVEFVDWSVNKRSVIRETAQGIDLVVEQDYRDTSFFALGAEWDVAPAVTLRAGVAYDASPVRDERRNIRTPDSDRYWAAIGVSWEASARLGVDVGYAYLRFEDAAATLAAGPAAGARVDYDQTRVHVIAVNGRVRF